MPPIIEPEFMELTSRLDVQAFWAEDALCADFTEKKPRPALSFSPDDHWLFEFLQVPAADTLRYYQEKAFRDDLHRQANQVTLRYVGRTFFEEDTWQHSPRRIENLFGSYYTYLAGSTPWLTPATDDPQEFVRLLDQAEAADLSRWALPEDFLQEWEMCKKSGKPLPGLGDGSRGPATVMTSVLHPEAVFYWIVDHPQLMQRFRDLLARKMVELNEVLRAFSGNTQPGWWVTDDNCALFNRRLYREYCLPVLSEVLETFAPGTAPRYQHSDSRMGHLLEEQAELGMTRVNYGPEVDAGLIRQKLPRAMIDGQMPPRLLRNGSPGEIRQRLIDDFHKAGAGGGLTVTTAGSLSAGTGVGRMRWMMQVLQEDCRYGG